MIHTILKNHIEYYFSLFVIFVLGIAGQLQTSGNRDAQIVLFLVVVFSYLLITLLHQYIHHTLRKKIMIEYVVMSLLGICIFFVILNSK